MPKEPLYQKTMILQNGGVVKTEDGTEILAVSEAGVPSVKADIQDSLARGSVYVGNSSGVTSELDASGDAKILVGDGSDLNSVSMTGDVTMDNTGATTIGASAVTASKVAGVVPADDSVQTWVPKVLRYSWDNTDPDGNNDIILYNTNSPAMLIIDAWLDMTTAEGGVMTVTLRDAVNGGGNAITSALDANSTGIERTTSLANNQLAGLSSLVANFSGDPGTAVGVLYVMYLQAAV